MNRKKVDELAKGLFDSVTGASDTQPTKDTKATKGTQGTKGRKATKGLHIPTPDQNISAPKMTPVTGKATPTHGAPFYRLNLKLSPELDGYLRDEAWVRRMSRTELVNQILVAYAKENPHT